MICHLLQLFAQDFGLWTLRLYYLEDLNKELYEVDFIEARSNVLQIFVRITVFDV